MGKAKCEIIDILYAMKLNVVEMLKDFASANGAENSQEEVAIIKGLLTVASSIVPKVTFLNREGRPTRLNLYYAVVANAGTNKSRIGNLEKLIMSIHEKVREEEQLRKSMLPKGGIRPPSKNVLITGNITRARAIEHLCANGDTPLLIVDSEMDSLTTSMQTDQGGFRAELRKAYHCEYISSSKKTDDEILEAHSPHLSVMVTGTFDQAVRYLYPLGDGFASRHLFDVNLAPTKFAQYGVDGHLSPSSTLSLWAVHFLKIWEEFSAKPVVILFNKGQLDRLNELAVQWEQAIDEGEIEISKDFLFRHILMLLKVASTLMVFESYFNGVKEGKLQCEDYLFDYAIELIQDSFEHLLNLYSLLPQHKEIKAKVSDKGLLLFNNLDDRFTTEDAYKKGLGFGLSERRVREVLRQYCTLRLTERISQGKYQKLN